jgi:hypothetical protein
VNIEIKIKIKIATSAFGGGMIDLFHHKKYLHEYLKANTSEYK